MRRLPVAILFVMLVGCAVYVRPAGPMPEGQAIDIAYRFTRGHGFYPSGTRYARYIRRGIWRVSLGLGGPSCGEVRMNIDAYNGRVFDFVPFQHPCGSPPPVIPEDRMDM